jgi:DNA-binding response OmpR family regulator
MPGPVSSLQLSRVLHERLPDAQILYTSGYAEGVLAHEGKVDATVHLLQKPYHPDALSARIRHLLRRKPQRSAANEPGSPAHFGLT